MSLSLEKSEIKEEPDASTAGETQMNINEIAEMFGEQAAANIEETLVEIRQDFQRRMSELNVPPDSYEIKEEFALEEDDMSINLSAVDYASGLHVDTKTGQLIQTETLQEAEDGSL